ncbi:MAG: DUF4139 domain-containing protein [Candidatus Cloacimonetes bacterium]|nr:DUF4139 domain-containing protein [Candidatus Cloacimonadota bacterium]
MKKILPIPLLLLMAALLADQVTIYNNDFALVRTNLSLQLAKGLQDYYFEDIPIMIDPNSVIITSEKEGLDIFSQNYEYDLANTRKIMQKYIGRSISLLTKSEYKFKGILQFNDFDTIGLIDETDGQLNLIQQDEIRNIVLDTLPENFFLKPTLHWQLLIPKNGEYPLEVSYLCRGMMWEVTYNTVWNEDKRILDINSWVTLTNETGKGFRDTKLKLIAGDVRKLDKDLYPERMTPDEAMYEEYAKGVPTFEEKAFHDFHLYTLSANVTINNNQTKQLQLFPLAKVKAEPKYEYRTHTDKIMGKIVFVNSKSNSLGIPLPRGTVMIYKLDEADDNLEFIGEDRIDHTPTDEEIELVTGYAFDLVGETVVLEQRKEGKNVLERDISVTLKNRGTSARKITIVHDLSAFWSIRSESLPYAKKDADTIEFEKKLSGGEVFTLSWTERIEYK